MPREKLLKTLKNILRARIANPRYRVFSAPAVLTGIAVYGAADYFFDISDVIDKNIGRQSEIWK